MSVVDFDFENALFFPYGYEFVPMLSGMFKQKRINSSVKLVSPEGWGIGGLDAGEAFGRPKMGIQISHDFISEIEKSKSLVIVPFKDTGNEETNQQLYRMIDENLHSAKLMGKSILDLRETVQEEMPEILESDKIEIGCPIIFVNGLMEQLNKLDVMVELQDSLTKKGYKVSTIGTKAYSYLLDMHPFPQFMFSAMPESQKIKLFRTFVHNIYNEEKPDIIMIGIPGASIPYNNAVDNGFGVLHFLVSMAVKADFSVTCTDLQYWDIEKLNTLFTHRFGHGIDCIVVSNTKIFYDPVEFYDKLFFETLDYTVIDPMIKKHPFVNKSPIYNIFNKTDAESLAEQVVNELGDVQFFAL